MRRLAGWVAMVAVVLSAAGCTEGSRTSENFPKWNPALPRTAMPAEATTVLADADAVGLAVAASRALFQFAPAAVLVGAADEAGIVEASTKAIQMGVPVLLAPESSDLDNSAKVRAELARLTATSVVPVGEAASTWLNTPAGGPSAPASAIANVNVNVARAGDVKPAAPLDKLLVLAVDDAVSKAALATAQATGAKILKLAQPDPRADAEAITQLSALKPANVLALGEAFGTAERLRQRIDTAATGVLLPGGRQVVFPGRRLVALYGHPGSNVLGSLGEQGIDAAIARAKKVAADYQKLVKEPVVPTFEIITTIASASAGDDGDYSRESSIEFLRPWIDAAKEAGIYVMLDLQPGHTDFLTQAKRYTELLKEPHVGLALDPEWRLKPNQKHMVNIGSVDAAEVNATAEWLAALTRDNKLPQKVLMVHQFRLDMITNRSALNTTLDELSLVLHADGFGTPGQKFDTWRALRAKSPADAWWGWKNFYDEDQPTFTPAQTVEIEPSPVFVSYQ